MKVLPASAWADDLAEYVTEVESRAPFIEAIRNADSSSERFDAILRYYRALWPVMKRTPPEQWANDIYEVPWLSYFSPIEEMLWSDIRTEGVILYPQHPVAGYFVDFGHPVAKVAIECDGAQWHQDKARDARRQAAIEARGWTVYRLTGSACRKASGEREDPETGQWVYEISNAQRLVREIGARHGIYA